MNNLIVSGNRLVLRETDLEQKKVFRIGLLMDLGFDDCPHLMRMRSAIQFAFRKKFGTEAKVEFTNVKFDTKLFVNLDTNKVSPEWIRAEQALQRVANILEKRGVDLAVMADATSIMMQPVIDQVGVLPKEIPDIVDEIQSYVTKKKYSTKSLVSVSVGLIGNENDVALLSDRNEVAPEIAEIRCRFSSKLVRYCIMPYNYRDNLMKILQSKDFWRKIKSHHGWFKQTMISFLKYHNFAVDKKNRWIYFDQHCPLPEICDIILTDVRTEAMALGLDRESYEKASRLPGKITKSLRNFSAEMEDWPERPYKPEASFEASNPVRLISVFDIYAKSIVEQLAHQK